MTVAADIAHAITDVLVDLVIDTREVLSSE